MNERDLTRILTEHVADVCFPDEAVRRIRMAVKEEKPVKKKRSLAIALVMALLLLAGVAVAAGTGLLEYLSQNFGQTALPEAADVIQPGMILTENDYAFYRVVETAYDGYSATILVEISPKDEETLLLPLAYSPGVPADWLIDGVEPELTIADYAAANGYTMVTTDVTLGSEYGIMRYHEWIDGRIKQLITLDMTGEYLPLTLHCHAAIVTVESNFPNQSFSCTTVPLELTASGICWQVSSDQVFDLDAYGIRIEGISAVGTVLQTYYTISYTCTGDGDLPLCLWQLRNADGTALPLGRLGSPGQVFGEMGRYCTVSLHYSALETAPDSLILQISNTFGDIETSECIFTFK